MPTMDWKNIIRQLIESGMKQQQIADAVGANQSVISDLANGNTTNPRYSTGAKLIALHKRRKAAQDSKEAA